MAAAKLVSLESVPTASGLLGFTALPVDPTTLKHALTAGRLPSETQRNDAARIWACAAQELGVNVGSGAERQFFFEALVPTLGFPLLDYLRFQTELTELGLDPADFAGQRTDFSIDTGRGLRLVIEVDGEQHLTPQHKIADQQRDAALRNAGWQVWRVPVASLQSPDALRKQLQSLLQSTRGGKWGLRLGSISPRSREVFSCVWGATAIARVQFLLLTAMQFGGLPLDREWVLSISEGETDVAELAIEDFLDWYGRLRQLYGLSALRGARLVSAGDSDVDLAISVSCTNPWQRHPGLGGPQAWSRPVNAWVEEPSLKFSTSEYLNDAPDPGLLESFVRDLFRKASFREGQLGILERILQGKDVVGLLPTGGGKSLTYQLAALLLPGATLYVAPLKSLLQDQYERFRVDGVDACGFISSALNTQERIIQETRFAAGQMRMLQVAPERFLMQGFRSLLDAYTASLGPVSQVVVDECHCASEWGHEFRPAYLSLSRIVRDRTARLGSSAPVVALTGTASSIVLQDVQRELGIASATAVVRASRLDRPELDMKFEQVTAVGKREALGKHASEFLTTRAGRQDGLLVFTRHVNGALGVYELAKNLAYRLKVPLGTAVRFFSGERPKALRNKPSDDEWSQVKAKAQRDFISPRGDSFRVLVATTAFGMGIDKPSIRKVLHFLAPQSPEAYYQEVGRAARDGEPAQAVMLISDEAAELTDSILSPNTPIEEARAQYQGIPQGQPVGDFLTTFYFHSNRFTGVREEAANLLNALGAIKARVDAGQAVVLRYLKKALPDQWDCETSLEFSLVRLIHLGFIQDYTKDFIGKTLSVSVEQDWLVARKDLSAYRTRCRDNFEAYVRRYETRRLSELTKEIASAETSAHLEEATLTAMVRYLYSVIEHRRRTATRTMLELARQGVTDATLARTRLLHYLEASEKFTAILEELAQSDQTGMDWAEIVGKETLPVEVDELRGTAARVLESYPTHPGLLMLNAITRRSPSEVDLARSKEEFEAALSILSRLDSPDTAADNAEEAIHRCRDIDERLARHLNAAYGAWSLTHFGARFALERVGNDRDMRLSIVKELLKAARSDIRNLHI
ncbi:DUF559 domain-containing protein [Cupriavidus necator]|uniref:DNA 3'-5' helicase n=1 Tax=Cupriavidus necator TaxID=106590 RepID=A0A367P639_CUPNE|nr:DUF559 domain-containing protein [Cupriavidus necator]